MILLPLLFVGFFWLIALGGLALWIWMIVDVVQCEPEANNNKVLWLIVVLLGGFVGALIYFFVRKLPREREAKLAPPAPHTGA